MVARNPSARKRPRPERQLDSGGAVIAAGNGQAECRRDDAICLARQAGPGPRM
jgi:hypothetical protein